MKFSFSSLLICSSICVLFMSSCHPAKDLEFRGFKNVSVENIGFSGASLKVNILCYNPNNYDLELNRLDLDLYVDSSFLGHSSQDLQVKIPRRQEFSVPLKVELDMQNLLKNGLAAIFGRQVLLKVIGKIRLGKAGVYKTFDLNYQTIQQISM